MTKQIIFYFLMSLALSQLSNLTYAKKINRDWCFTLLEIKDTVEVPDSVAEPMCMQCAIFQKEAIDEIRRICKIVDIEDRQQAADMFNYHHKDEYNIYIQMVRTLREYMERKCLGSAAAIMSYDVVKTNAEIDIMFTIFRSRRPLPNNKYTNPK
ncbi:MAG: hypothetical protein NC039_04960 [Muribaculaceae bacterium]|nr:hypothetical protein [Muribaculaceae bacterium]